MSTGTARAANRVTFWSVFTDFPPYYIRLFAKKDAYTALSEAEIAIASGLSLNRVREIVQLEDWGTVTFGEIVAFTAACNFDPTSRRDRHRVWQYEYTCRTRKKVPFYYLRKSPKWESEILPIIRRLQSRAKSYAA